MDRGYVDFARLHVFAEFQASFVVRAKRNLQFHLGERGEDPDLDGDLHLRAGRVLKKRLGIEHSLYTILQILSVTLFEKVPVAEALSTTGDTLTNSDIPNQLQLFN